MALKELGTALRVQRLRWSGHMKRINGGAMRRAVGVVVARCNLQGSPNMTWSEYVKRGFSRTGHWRLRK